MDRMLPIRGAYCDLKWAFLEFLWRFLRTLRAFLPNEAWEERRGTTTERMWTTPSLTKLKLYNIFVSDLFQLWERIEWSADTNFLHAFPRSFFRKNAGMSRLPRLRRDEQIDDENQLCRNSLFAARGRCRTLRAHDLAAGRYKSRRTWSLTLATDSGTTKAQMTCGIVRKPLDRPWLLTLLHQIRLIPDDLSRLKGLSA